MAFCERLSEQLAVVATVDPQAGAGAATTDIVLMTNHRRALFIFSHGAGTAGMGVAIQEANAGFTAGTANILTAANTVVGVTANTQNLFEVSAEAMGAGLTALRGVFTAVGADIFSVVVLADVIRYHPASDYDLGSVINIQVAN